MPDKMVGNWQRLDGDKFREDTTEQRARLTFVGGSPFGPRVKPEGSCLRHKDMFEASW